MHYSWLQGSADSPFQRAGAQVDVGLDSRGTLKVCPSAINPNCYGTNARSPEQVAPIWTAPEELSAAQCADRITSTAQASLLGAEVEERQELSDGSRYVRLGVDGKWARDVVEVLVRVPEADGAGCLVAYRSINGLVKYQYPLQTARRDGGAQKERMESLRQRLGWRLRNYSDAEEYFSSY